MQGKSRIYLCSACLSIPVRSQELCTALILSMFSSNCREEFLTMSLTKCKNDLSKKLSFICTVFIFWKCDCCLRRCFKIALTGKTYRVLSTQRNLSWLILTVCLTKCKNDLSKKLSFLCTVFLLWKCDCFLCRCFKIASTGNKYRVLATQRNSSWLTLSVIWTFPGWVVVWSLFAQAE